MSWARDPPQLLLRNHFNCKYQGNCDDDDDNREIEDMFVFLVGGIQFCPTFFNAINKYRLKLIPVHSNIVIMVSLRKHGQLKLSPREGQHFSINSIYNI